MRKSNKEKAFMFIHPRHDEKIFNTDSMFWAVILTLAFIVGLVVYFV